MSCDLSAVTAYWTSLEEKFSLPSEAIYEYVKAMVDVPKEKLQVRLDQEVIDEWEYKLR